MGKNGRILSKFCNICRPTFVHSKLMAVRLQSYEPLAYNIYCNASELTD